MWIEESQWHHLTHSVATSISVIVCAWHHRKSLTPPFHAAQSREHPPPPHSLPRPAEPKITAPLHVNVLKSRQRSATTKHRRRKWLAQQKSAAWKGLGQTWRPRWQDKKDMQGHFNSKQTTVLSDVRISTRFKKKHLKPHRWSPFSWVIPLNREIPLMLFEAELLNFYFLCVWCMWTWLRRYLQIALEQKYKYLCIKKTFWVKVKSIFNSYTSVKVIKSKLKCTSEVKYSFRRIPKMCLEHHTVLCYIYRHFLYF